jgi:hypothetical protein
VTIELTVRSTGCLITESVEGRLILLASRHLHPRLCGGSMGSKLSLAVEACVESGISLIALNRVIAAHPQRLRGMVAHGRPTGCGQKPELAQRWEVLRSTDAVDGVVNFVFLFQGGPLEDWDLEPMLEEALGVDGASRAMSQFADMLADQQQAWSLARVDLAD